jgi:DNA binding domain, excisionase family
MKNKTIQGKEPLLFRNYSDVLDVRQTAALLSVSPNSVYKLIREQSLPCRRIGVAIRIRKSDVMRFMETNAEESHI